MATTKFPVQRSTPPSLPRGWKFLLIPDHIVQQFFGNNTIISDIQKVSDGFSPDSINWLSGDESDCIVLRRGTALLGKTRGAAPGKINGMGIGTRVDGTQIPFFAASEAEQVYYYDSVSNDRIQIGNNLLGVAAQNDIVWIAPYQNLAGAFVYLSSINSDVYKIPVANPANAVKQFSTGFRGGIKFGQSRMLMFSQYGVNGERDLTGLYMSWIDKVIKANYMTTTIAYMPAGAPGLNDASSVAPSTNLESGTTYNVIIDSIAGSGNSNVFDTFKWNTSNAAGYTTGVPIVAGMALQLADGVYVKFASQNGHTLADAWAIISGPAQAVSEAVGLLGQQAYNAYQLLQVPGTIGLNNLGARTAFGITVQAQVPAGVEIFSDDGNGNLTSNYGGTGTINYATGIVSIKFSAVTTGNVTTTYFWEDATQKGVVDFSIQYDTTVTPPARIAGSGRYFAQYDGGGSLQVVFPFSNIFYGMHTKKSWQTSVPSNDSDTGTTPSSNLAFRDLMGISSPLGAYGAADGLYLINNANLGRPKVVKIVPKSGATAANQAGVDDTVSEFLDLSAFAFDKAVMFVWDIYVLLAFQQIRNGITDPFTSRTYVMNTRTGAWDLTDYPATAFEDYMGSLLAGDPLSDNVFTYFSGFDDDGALIPNYWTSGYTNHGIGGQKKTGRMVVNGLIQSAQRIQVSIALDGGNWNDIFVIEGDGSYVNRSSSISVGQNTVGSKINGGGGEVFANPFEVEFPLNTDRYEYIRVKFEALNGGYAQINFYTWKNNRYKSQSSPPSRMAGGS